MTENEDSDRGLADELGTALSGSNDDAFIEMVMNRADQTGLLNTTHWWDVLDTWARPGMAAAAVGAIILMATIAATGRIDEQPASIAAGLSNEVEAAELAEPAPPNPETMLAVAFAN
jgi:hypothetical protein